MDYLLTGATGFIGQHLVVELLQAGAEVALLVREGYAGMPLPGLLAPLRPQLHLVYADLRNYNLTVRAVCEANPERVIHPPSGPPSSRSRRRPRASATPFCPSIPP